MSKSVDVLAKKDEKAIKELVKAANEMRLNFRCVLSVNCKCDEEFVDRQTERFDAALARIQGESP